MPTHGEVNSARNLRATLPSAPVQVTPGAFTHALQVPFPVPPHTEAQRLVRGASVPGGAVVTGPAILSTQQLPVGAVPPMATVMSSAGPTLGIDIEWGDWLCPQCHCSLPTSESDPEVQAFLAETTSPALRLYTSQRGVSSGQTPASPPLMY
ncbi:hypothetical protein JG687_00004526 [Phytophthora cactorum]|uniref:Uncharacterized protein n=1 Tax=Phytophthora cactorum TaxID=29920 RepID=A0A329S8N8_9STRA|nr:hypothetical protein Pcac1_g26783 [Phytophthora cactorum]KAG2821642.1 hypothetical protein PC112_g11278 [Phytophthora cactorum]KAG2824171.1 hypothetical protein PC111_g9938 [Phytophthora cactorum]KAG2856176.1 hypothetical protein PC113_g11795 [Phytophthora cactorum]KAG2903367.1 hypothetical protein PC114_g12298 [Phytophthora cactorum]